MAHLLRDRRLSLFCAALLGAAMIGGCGWTPRDEFYLSRREVAHPIPGDGSRVTFGGQQPGWRTSDATDAELVWTPGDEASVAEP